MSSSSVAIYTLLGTARLNGVDPERWLREVLSRIADQPISRIEELLPWNMAADHLRSVHLKGGGH
jgi:transposase